MSVNVSDIIRKLSIHFKNRYC